LSTSPTRFHKNSHQRRSQRVLLAVRILVTGVRADGQGFSEEICTSVVNVRGALLQLGERVFQGQLLTVRNLSSSQQLQAAVVAAGVMQSGKSEIGIEFLEPAPRFWRISFPPEDWSPHSPEAKRITLAPTLFPRVISPK
jgi:hypothetical protein